METVMEKAVKEIRMWRYEQSRWDVKEWNRENAIESIMEGVCYQCGEDVKNGKKEKVDCDVWHCVELNKEVTEKEVIDYWSEYLFSANGYMLWDPECYERHGQWFANDVDVIRWETESAKERERKKREKMKKERRLFRFDELDENVKDCVMNRMRWREGWDEGMDDCWKDDCEKIGLKIEKQPYMWYKETMDETEIVVSGYYEWRERKREWVAEDMVEIVEELERLQKENDYCIIANVDWRKAQKRVIEVEFSDDERFFGEKTEKELETMEKVKGCVVKLLEVYYERMRMEVEYIMSESKRDEIIEMIEEDDEMWFSECGRLEYENGNGW